MANGKWEGPDRRQTSEYQEIISHIDKRFDELKTAFPGGDLDGHRRAHEGTIRASETWAKMRMAVVEALLKTGVVGAAVTLAAILWQNFKDSITK